jgi:epoxyqueuosine reductase QueG
MDREKLQSLLSRICEEAQTNYLQPPVTPEEAERARQEADTGNFRKNNYFGKGEFDPAIYNKDKEERYIGLRFFGEPVFSVGAADDPVFLQLRQEGVVGPHHKLPADWLPEAKRVISIFLPYSDRVLSSNLADPELPSMEWMFTRVDGQNHLLAVGLAAAEALREEGWQAVVPQTDSRFQLQTARQVMGEGTPLFTSNWSERHVAYASGLGTFGLHTCLITRAGCAGRFISVVTDCPLEPDKKDYAGYLDYCSRCGACQRRCPAGAIGENCTKDKPACSAYIGKVSAAHSPRYGCGKCQSAIPCQRRAMGIRA